MDKLTYLVSIKAFFEDKNDIISTFAYIVLQVIDKDTDTFTKIHDKIIDIFNVDMPITLVSKCVKSLKKKEFCILNNEKIILTDKGRKQITVINDAITNSNREIKQLLNTFVEQLPPQKRNSYSYDLILSTLTKLLEINIHYIVEGNELLSNNEDNKDKELERDLIEFIINCEHNDATSFKVLQDLAQGIVINTIITRKNIEKINENFSPLTIFLDTNVVFGLLGLADENIQKISYELIDMIKRKYKNCSIKVFPFTIEEIHSFIANYQHHSSIFRNISKDTSYSRIKGANFALSNMSDSDISILQATLEKKLSAKGIIINEDYKEDLTIPTELEELYEIKKEFWPNKEYNSHTLRHDVNSIKWVRKLRSRKFYSVEDCKYIFVSLDNKLFRYAQKEHQKNNSVSEIILLDTFINLLWIKKPDFNSSLPLHNIIAGCKEKIMINENVLITMKTIMRKMIENKEVNEKDVSILDSNLLLSQLEGKNYVSEEEGKELIYLTKERFEEQIHTLEQKNNDIKHKLSVIEDENKKNIKLYEQHKNQLHTIITIIASGLSIIILLLLLIFIGIFLYYLCLFPELFAKNLKFDLEICSFEKLTTLGWLVIMSFITIFIIYKKYYQNLTLTIRGKIYSLLNTKYENK